MKAGQVVLQKLLDGKIQYRVPLFQRTYNWKEKEWETLWTDILEIYAMDQPRNHFIGAVVTQPVPDAPERASKHLLIDGQQRLTTICIILSCLRRKALEAGDDALSQEILETCLVNKFESDEKGRIKLHPTQRDREPFSTIVNEDGDIEGEGQIIAAFKHFLKRITDGDLEGYALDLGKLKSCVTNHLDLVSITLDTEDSPHRIFESLNNTGMQLGHSDLIRNLIFMNIPVEADAQEAYDQYWLPVQEKTGVHLDDFFWRYLMMDGSLPTWGETFEEVKRRFGAGGTQRAKDELVQFSKFARFYRRLREIEDQDELFMGEIKRINTWEVDVAYSFLMRSLNLVEDCRITSDEMKTVIRMIESFVVRRTICSIPTNRLRRIFARMSEEVTPTDFVTSAREYLLANQWPSDSEFQEAFIGFRLYLRSRLARTRLILESLEESFEHKESPEITEQITIEHIMPQNITSEWMDMLGPDGWEIHSRWLDTPGNLTLTGYNPELSDSPFHKKKELLSHSKFSLTSTVLQQDQWSEHAIKARGEELAERAATIWER